MQSVTTVLPLVLPYLRGHGRTPLAFSGSDGHEGSEGTAGAWWRKSCIAGLATNLTQEWTIRTASGSALAMLLALAPLAEECSHWIALQC